ncbi:hypothetical protein BLX24_24630 [Arsenicibacter rosenii]|uniref:Major facilitator superfamily (MFS) profile domain-containing protein n=2 Tax=Arsenicibacter rosenii TaxID=1750698 RepID=A0A1S2VE09_9BACT|nr:hypothetical protein BLX24_24630 [Arsenicibacter rosenii]
MGVLLSWQFSKRTGHWKTLVWVTALYLITAIGCSLAPDLYLLAFFIGAGGVCLGGTIVSLPVYVMEVVPVSFRSKTIILFSVATILSMQLTYTLLPVYTIYWRWIPGAEAIVALGLMLSLFTIPEQGRPLTAGSPEITMDTAGQGPQPVLNGHPQAGMAESGTVSK